MLSHRSECFHFCFAFPGNTRCAVNTVLVPTELQMKDVKN